MALLAFVVVVIATVGYFQTQDLTRDGRDAHNKICALSAELQSRLPRELRTLANAERFLRQNPNGALGFSAAQLKESVDDRRASVRNLEKTIEILDCGG